MDSKKIQKYSDKNIDQLKGTAQKWFNKFIRLRDTDENGNGFCISSGKPLKYGHPNCHAGHYYPSTVSELKFNEDNVNLQSKGDNYYKHSNAIEYGKKLVEKIGQERMDRLRFIADHYKRISFKWDRVSLIEIIETYKEKCKELAKEKNFKVK